MRYFSSLTFPCVVTLTFSASAAADITVFTDKDEWESAVGEFTTIDFTGFPHATPIDDQYSSFGVNFTAGERIFGPSPSLFLNDGMGLWNNFAEPGIVAEFSQPMQWIAIDFPGFAAIDLYNGEKLVGKTGFLGVGGGGNFGGLISTVVFDRAIIFDPFDDAVAIDDLHFGPPIPTPGALGLLAIAVLTSRRRR